MSTQPASFTVAFGKVARTVEYHDHGGCITFTFDGGGERSLVLEHHGIRHRRPPNYHEAFGRAKQFLESCSYMVEEYGVGRPPVPLTEKEVDALISTHIQQPISPSISLVVPPARAGFTDDTNGSEWNLWLVAVLLTGPHHGHKVVFDELTQQFGVASPTNVFHGFWGSFAQTLEALLAS